MLKIIDANRSECRIEFLGDVRKQMFDAGQTQSADEFVRHAQPIDQHRLKTIEENVMIVFEFFGHLKDVKDMFE